MAQRTINTPREITHQRIADALEDMVDKMVDTSSASNIDYDNTQSGLSANKIQGAVDELASEKADKSTTLAGYGITDAYTKAEVYTQSEVNNIVSTLETNIDWKEAVNTYADIATTYPNPQDGWTVNVKDTDYTYRYNGSEWVAISANAIPEATTSVKGLMTPTQVSKLNGIEAGAQVNTVTSVAGKTGAVTLTKSDVGLGNVDNTSDLNKPISTAAQTALNSKVDKVAGKGLSTNDYTNEEKQKNADNASAIEDIQEDISTSQTATGNPLTIQASESNLVECVAEVEPVQDLHGYDHPWVGGAGKNKLPMTVEGIKAANTSGTWNGNVYSINNGTIEILVDSDNNVIGLNANGTFNELYFDIGEPIITGNSRLTGCPSGGDFNTLYALYLLRPNSGAIVNDSGNGNDIILQTNDSVWIVIRNGTTVSNVIFKPMVGTDMTATYNDFAPYSNICPISGRMEEVITQKDNPTNPTVTKTYTIQIGQTVYGGQLDVTRGKMVVDKGYADLGDLTWVKSGNKTFYATISNALGVNGKKQVICSAYETVNSNNISTLDYYFDKAIALVQAQSQVAVVDSSYSDATTFKTAVTGQQLVYELATPYTIQLTPQQIRLLKGTNNISCNTGDLSIKYYPDNVLGQLKGDIENEYDERITELEEKANTPTIKQVEINRNAVSTDGSVMFTSLTGHIIVGTSISNDANGNKCVGIPYSMGSVPALKIMNESTMAVLPNITISGTLYCIKL